ncbi:conserved hypothetical protein [Maribacter litoralis]|uniref:Uncharacterized protein n=1 Tax=Maribacter litoralis TaxID=2059726 RepID=A0A653NF86_9FLAO|nr:conserved hypothetical protein [Maribacter litoralis]
MVDHRHNFNTKPSVFEIEIEFYKKIKSKTAIFKYNYYFSQRLQEQ